MGWLFDIDHVNFVNYLTMEQMLPEHDPRRPQHFEAPRSPGGRLRSFLGVLEGGTSGIISSSQRWLDDVASAAAHARRTLDRFDPQWSTETALDSEQVAMVLEPLRRLFQGYPIYALIIPEDSSRVDSPEREFFQEAALSSQHEGLILMPNGPPGLLRVLDPFPAMRALTKMPVAPPAVVFWTSLGGACALVLEKAKDFFRNEILDSLRGGKRAIDQLLRDRAAESRTRNLLHISDLHFGDATSDESRRYIKSHFDLILKGIDRVVLTGDLFNTPDATLRDQFLDFRADIERMTRKPLVVIPGNHDVRPRGNVVRGLLRQTYEFIVDVGWRPLIIDDELNCVFFCFNSCEEGVLARGCVTGSQRMRLAAEFNEEIARRRRNDGVDLDSYSKIALVHHHPFAYETIASASYDAFLRRMTGSEDSFTRFEQAEEFISWCAERKVSLILHGHKHVPHHITATISVAGRPHTLVSVGCGSTTGAENSPLCYDVVSLDPETSRWGVTFHYDASKSGAGFREQELIIDTRAASSVW